MNIFEKFEMRIEDSIEDWLKKRPFVIKRAEKEEKDNIFSAAQQAYIKLIQTVNKDYKGYDPYSYERDPSIDSFATQYSKVLEAGLFAGQKITGFSLKDKKYAQKSFDDNLNSYNRESLRKTAVHYRTSAVATIIVLAIVALMGWYIKYGGPNPNSSNNSSNTQSKQAPNTNNGSSTQSSIGPYVSSIDGFDIQFPGVPTVDPGTDAAGYKYDAYSYSQGDYVVLVDNNPSPSQQLMDSYEASLEKSFGLTPTSPIQNTTLNGYPAIYGEYTSSQDGATTYAYTFYNSSQEIIIMTQNVNSTSFNSFANSYYDLN